MAIKKAKRAKLSNMAPLFGDCELFTVVLRKGCGVLGGSEGQNLDCYDNLWYLYKN